MASVNWKKLKTATEVKAIMRHDERDKRQQTGEHSNPDIDRSRTRLNFSVAGRSYADRCKMYDDAMTDAAQHSKRKLRADAVTCLALCTTMPDGLTDEQAHDWFTRVHELMCEQFGAANVIDTDVHMDEIHDYYDPDKNEVVTSRPHAHTAVIPRTVDGRLCCKEVSSRSAIMALNTAIEEMTQKEYGVQFMTGEGKKGRSVEQLKADSFIAAQDEEQRAIEHRHELVTKNSELYKRNAELRAENDELKCSMRRSRADAAADRERARQEREAAERDRAAARQERAAARAEREQAQQLAEAARQALSAAERTSSFEEYFKRKAPENYERINQTRQREREQAAQNARNVQKLQRGGELNAPQPEQQPDGGYLKGY